MIDEVTKRWIRNASDEKAAAKAPFTSGANNLNGGWGEIRRRDGTVIKQ